LRAFQHINTHHIGQVDGRIEAGLQVAIDIDRDIGIDAWSLRALHANAAQVRLGADAVAIHAQPRHDLAKVEQVGDAFRAQRLPGRTEL